MAKKKVVTDVVTLMLHQHLKLYSLILSFFTHYGYLTFEAFHKLDDASKLEEDSE